MIIPTGSIRMLTLQGGGFERGKPVKPTVVESEPIPANIKTTKQQVYDTGSQAWVSRQGFIILVAASSTVEINNTNKVKIFDSKGTAKGEFEVQSAQYLDYVDAIQLTI